MREVYADHAATTPPSDEVYQAMAPFLGESFGNASSVHRRGEAAREAVERARAQVAELVGAAADSVVFTSSGSESNNLALKGLLEADPMPGIAARKRLVVSAVEHPSVLETARHLAGRGFELTVAPVDADGLVDPKGIASLMGEDVALVSVMLANNETGAIQPIAEIAAIAHAAGARMHTDAVQAVGKLPVDFADLGVDLLSLAGHKFYGPSGAAALVVRRRTRLLPLIHGGHQERSRRAGTENLPALVGLGVAAARARRHLSTGEARLVQLGGRLLEGLLAAVPGASLNGPREARLPGLVNLRFPGVDGEAMLHELDRAGITVSTGSACSAASQGPSHVLLAMGLRPEDAHASVRFSLGEPNDESDVERIVAAVPVALERLRALDRADSRRSA